MTAIALAARVYRALIAAGVAVESVSIGDDDDRSTWRVQPSRLQSAAQPVINAFTLPNAQQLADEELEREIGRKFVRALVLGFLEVLPDPKPTSAELLTRIRAIYRSLP